MAKIIRGTRADIEGEDDQESYFKWLEENPNAGLAMTDNDDEDRELEYDNEGNIVVPEKSKVIINFQKNQYILSHFYFMKLIF
jgi:hypothetical protein